MRFGNTDEHAAIAAAASVVQDSMNIRLLRADDGQFHSGLLENVETYMRGCAFGVAFFEDAEASGFNPNVAFEVGYMRALGKPLLLMKSKSLRRMSSDLIGSLYTGYDPAQGSNHISGLIGDWITNHFLHSPADADFLSRDSILRLLTTLYPARKLEDRPEHLAQHMEGLRMFGYSTVSQVRALLSQTEAERARVTDDRYLQNRTAEVAYALAIMHPEYLEEPFWTGTTKARLRAVGQTFHARRTGGAT